MGLHSMKRKYLQEEDDMHSESLNLPKRRLTRKDIAEMMMDPIDTKNTKWKYELVPPVFDQYDQDAALFLEEPRKGTTGRNQRSYQRQWLTHSSPSRQIERQINFFKTPIYNYEHWHWHLYDKYLLNGRERSIRRSRPAFAFRDEGYYDQNDWDED